MHTPLLPFLEDAWREGREALREALSQTVAGLEELLRLEEYHRHGHEDQPLREALGRFGETSFNLESLSSLLQHSVRSRHMTQERYHHAQELLAALREAQRRFESAPPMCEVASIEEDEAAIHERAERHFNEMAALFRRLRIAHLEIKAKYQPKRHDTLFVDFNWRHLGPSEIRLCPPFLVVARLHSDDGAALRKIMSLLTSRKPIKILALREALRKAYPLTSETHIPATMDVEMLPLALRGVYVLQTSVTQADFAARLAAALRSPRPGVLSLFWQAGAPDDPEFRIRADRALLSRTFPVFEYNPDRANEFVSCFDLSGNPDMDADWGRQTLVYLDENGAPSEMKRNFTFANFASEEPEFAGGFADPPADATADSLVPLSSYLGFSRQQRAGTLPYVTVCDRSQRLVRKVPSQEIITQTSDRLHLWRTLKEFAGIDNPHVHAARTELHTQLGGECKVSLERLREQMETEARLRERTAMAQAVRTITSYLTGIDASQIPLDTILASKAPDNAPPPSPAP